MVSGDPARIGAAERGDTTGRNNPFFRRSALDHLQGWDAHNETEDADLGVRLSRYGWRCDILDSTTFEEADNRPLAWVKQRSRWLKGYAMTYFVHMRNPLLLCKFLGGRQFLLMQIVFLHTLITYTLAPIFWALWLLTAALGSVCLHGMAMCRNPLGPPIFIDKSSRMCKKRINR